MDRSSRTLSRKSANKSKSKRGASLSSARSGGARKQKVKTSFMGSIARNWRFGVLNVAVCSLALLLVGRIAALQVMPDVEQGYEFLQYQGEARTIREQEIPAYRGSITDRKGEPLAISTPLVALWINPSRFNVANLDSLASALGEDLGDLKARFQQYKDKQFMYLRRGMSPANAEKILDLGLAGLYGETEYRRFYPEAEVTAQLKGLIEG